MLLRKSWFSVLYTWFSSENRVLSGFFGFLKNRIPSLCRYVEAYPDADELAQYQRHRRQGCECCTLHSVFAHQGRSLWSIHSTSSTGWQKYSGTQILLTWRWDLGPDRWRLYILDSTLILMSTKSVSPSTFVTLYNTLSVLTVSLRICNAVHPGCKVYDFVQQKLTLQAVWPYIQSHLL